MQLFSPVAAAFPLLTQAAAVPNAAAGLQQQYQEIMAQMQAQIAQHASQILLLFLLAPVLQILGYWVASLAVAGEQGRLLNALKVWALYLLTFIGIFIAAFVGGLIMGMAHLALGLPLLGLAIFLLFLIVIFAIPMKVYEIGFLRAFGFLVLSFIITLIGQAAVDVTLGTPLRPIVEAAQKLAAMGPAISALPPSEQQKFTANLKFLNFNLHTAASALPGETTAGDPGKPLPEREAGLKLMYLELDKRRKDIAPGDQAAIAVYEADKARYEELLKQLRAEANRKTP
jgi:hypothetical protein